MASRRSRSDPFQPVPFPRVRIEDSFWAPRIRTNRERTIPHVYWQLKQTGRIDAFRLDWKPGIEPKPHIFWGSDVAKWVEGASYDLALHPNPELEKLLDEVTSLIASAQQPDGYLNVFFTVVSPDKRWTNLRDWHELYCAGHLIEAGVAHYQATGKRTLLDAMIRYAAHIDSVFGREPGKKRGYPGHPEIELALMKLYQVRRDDRHLALGKYFVDERGQQPSYFAAEPARREERNRPVFPLEYCQAHLPLRQQTDAVGHAVRAMYLYSGAADVARETGDAELHAVLARLWESATARRMYITGGVGSTGEGERFTTDYHLPNESAYAETCAAIALVFFAHRMLQFDCDSRYADVMERALYNGLISGVSLDGASFFYVNPLASRGDHHRQPWFDCACCPPNIVRLLPTIGGYVYSAAADAIAVHLYVESEADVTLPSGLSLALRQETRYPWEGSVKLTVNPASPAELTLRLRIPGWCRSHQLAVNGEPVKARTQRGYACITRQWRAGDVVELDLAMPVEKMEAHPEVVPDFGRVALQRGPIVYCLEDADHQVSVRELALPTNARLAPRHDPSMLGGVTVLEGQARLTSPRRWDKALYLPARSPRGRAALRAIPYCVWDSRAAGSMIVWLPRA